MKQIKSHRVRRILALTLALSLLLTACGGGGASAATMHLRRAEGTVGVSDGEGKAVEPRDDLGLYSGYGVDTQTESYAWIDLDEVKLTKLDQDSEIAITKEGKKLEIEVKTGNLFFNVTEPLDDDETLNIRSSTMLVGIRGTCGWVTQDAAALLEGTVEVTAGEQTVTVNAGEMAVLTDGALEVKPFSSSSVPAFVKEEIADDEDLAEEIKTASGIDVTASLEADYADAFADIASRGGEVIFAEEIDFEADGSPELLVIYTDTDERNGYVASYVFDIFRKGTERFEHLYTRRFGVLEGRSGKISLVESGGRLFVLNYELIGPDSTAKGDDYIYYGSTAQNDGDSSCWGRIEWAKSYAMRNYSLDYYTDERKENGLGIGGTKLTTIEEYEAIIQKYNEVRVLVSVD